MNELKLSIEDLKYAQLQLKFETLQCQYHQLWKELELYRSHYPRPVVVKKIIHHPARPRDSQCLYGAPAYDEVVYL